MLSRELLRWNKLITRRMKKTTSSSHPWKILFSRNVTKEVFEVLKLSVLEGGYGSLMKTTKSKVYLSITTRSVIEWMLFVICNGEAADIKEEDILCKHLKNGEYCEAVVDKGHAFAISYSKTQEVVKVVLFYGCWNPFGVPQHIL